MTTKIKCRICGEKLGEEFNLADAVIHLLECHADLLEALATWLMEEAEE